jgi:tetratricopeptide (TPR) repeat protein
MPPIPAPGTPAARFYYQLDQNDNAMQAFRKTVEFQPDHAQAHYRLGYLHYVSKDFASARESYGNATRHDAGNAKAFFNLAKTEEQIGNIPAAMAAYRKALAIDPAYYNAHLNLGILHYRAREYAAALQQFRLAARINPSHPAALIYQGRCLTTRSSMPQRPGCTRPRWLWTQTVFLRPTTWAACTRRPAIPPGGGSYRQALQIQPRSVEALCNLGNALLKLDKVPEALTSLLEAIAIKPDDVETNLALSKAYRLSGQLAAAGRHAQAVINAAPGNHNGYISSGLILSAQGLHDEAIRAFTRALDLQPENIEARFNLAEALRLHKDYGQAMQMYEKVVKIDPRNGLARQRIGRSTCCRGDGARPGSPFRRFWTTFPATPKKPRSCGIWPSCAEDSRQAGSFRIDRQCAGRGALSAEENGQGDGGYDDQAARKHGGGVFFSGKNNRKQGAEGDCEELDHAALGDLEAVVGP